jgi:hypothetical protein
MFNSGFMLVFIKLKHYRAFKAEASVGKERLGSGGMLGIVHQQHGIMISLTDKFSLRSRGKWA